MESLGSKISKALIKRMHFKDLMSLEGEAFWEDVREQKMRKPIVLRPNIFRDLHMEEIDIGEYDVYRIYPEKDDAKKLIIYLHGGTFVYSILPFHFNFIYDLLESTKIQAVVPLYPLLPEGTADMIHSRLIEVYESVLDSGIDPKDIIFMGDSSGGYLSLLAMHLYKKRNIPLPKQMVLISPLLDLCSPPDGAEVFEEKDPFIAMGCREALYKKLSEGRSVDDPLVSPRFGNFSDFPKTDIISGTDDLLHLQAIKFYQEKKDEFDLKLHLYDDMIHNFPLIPTIEGLQARKFIKKLIIPD
ncbi:MAG: alpha/beta hydrolase [Andreesenia angusta]|nr:alpha/beta hydrolase [Andreesenia angusta]